MSQLQSIHVFICRLCMKHVLWTKDLPFLILICFKWVFLERSAALTVIWCRTEEPWSLNGTISDVKPMHHSQMASGIQQIAKCITTTVWFHQLEDTFVQQYGWFYGTAHNITWLCTLPFSLNNCSLSIKRSVCWVATPTLPDCSSFTWSPLCAELSYSARFLGMLLTTVLEQGKPEEIVP